MGKKAIFKYVGLGLVSLILFPIAPIIIGGYVIFRIIKSSFPKRNKIVFVVLIVVASFFLTGKIVSALPSPSTTPKPEAKSEKINVPSDTKPMSQTTPQSDPNITYANVVNVVDGDTFTLDSGKVVRMIGIDTPETVAPGKPIQCYGKEASKKTEELIDGKTVKLEKDVSETDRYNRLLRYVYVDDIFVNEYLVAEGYAKASSYPPDIKYQGKFTEAQRKAQEENKGLWNPLVCQTNAPTPKPRITTKTTTSKPTTTYTAPAPTTQSTNNSGGGSYACDCSKTCPNMSCNEAQYQLNVCGCSARDNDHDGIACDAQCQ